MIVTRKHIAGKLINYLDNRISLVQLVDWAEDAIREAEFSDPSDPKTIRDVVARIGLADVKAFGLEWEDYKGLLSDLGYQAKISVQPQP